MVSKNHHDPIKETENPKIYDDYELSVVDRDHLFIEFIIISRITAEQFSVKLMHVKELEDEIKKQIEKKSFILSYDFEKEALRISYTPQNTSISKKETLFLQKDSGASPLVRVGTCDEIEQLMKDYPVTRFKYYATYNNLNPLPIVVNWWNKGLRIMFTDFYPEGDDGRSLKLGNAVWTKGTVDPESQGDKFYHRYVNSVNSDLKENWSNKISPCNIFVQRF